MSLLKPRVLTQARRAARYRNAQRWKTGLTPRVCGGDGRDRPSVDPSEA